MNHYHGWRRSGTTITGGLSLGFTRADAARYSFLLSIPATTLAGVFELKHLLALTLEFVKQGGRALLVAGDRKGSLRTDSTGSSRARPSRRRTRSTTSSRGTS